MLWKFVDQRGDIVRELSLDQSLWEKLRELWNALAETLHPTKASSGSSEDSLTNLALALAKLDRNLVAGLEDHQAKALYVYQQY